MRTAVNSTGSPNTGGSQSQDGGSYGRQIFLLWAGHSRKSRRLARSRCKITWMASGWPDLFTAGGHEGIGQARGDAGVAGHRGH